MAGGHFKKPDNQKPEEPDFDPLFDSSGSDAWMPGATQAQAAQYAKQQAEAIERARQQAEAAQRAWLEAEAAERARLQAEAEERARRQAAAAELARKQAEAAEKARLKAEEAERARKQAEEQARRQAEEAERARREAEEQARREAEERARKQAEAEAARKEAEAARLQAEAEAERARQEAEAARLQAEAEERARREAEEQARREAEERARKQAEERARKEAEAAEQARLIAEAEERARKAEEAVERARQQAEAEAQERALREAEAAEAVRQEAEAARQQALEAEAARKQAEEAAEAARKQVEEAIQQAKAAEEARQAAEAEAARQIAEAQEARQQAEAEAARQVAEAEERSRHEADERERAQGETEAARQEAEAARQATEAARQAAEAEQLARQQAEAEAQAARQQAEEANLARQAAEAEAARQQAEAEERARQEAKAKAEAERQEAEAAEQARIAAEAEAERQRREEEERQRREAREAREAEERARKEAEEQARREAEEEEARQQAEAEAARQAEKAERARQEAERKQAEADELARLEAAAEKARQEADNARQQAEASAERTRLEEEARQARAEAEAARAEAEAARQQAEAEAKRAREGAQAAKRASSQRDTYNAEQDALFSPAGVPNISRGAAATSANRPVGAPPSAPVTTVMSAAPAGEQQPRRQRRPKATRGNHGGPNKSRAIKICAGVIGAIVLIFALSGFMVMRDAQALVNQKSSIMSQATTLTKGIMNGDSDSVKTSSESIASQVSSMRSTTSSPFWGVASAIPVLGDDIRAARGLVEQADNLCQNAMLPAVSALDGVSLASLGKDETVNLDKLQSVLSALSQISPVVSQSSTAINELPEPHMGQLKSAIDSIKEPLSSLSTLLGQLDSYGSLLPQMLGSDGSTRTYLLAAQNNAELRPTGGLPGSIGTLTITNGHISMGDFIGTATITDLEGAAAYGVTAEETALFGDRVGKITNDTNFIPDFSRVGTVFAEIWEGKTGTHIDGVIAIDPVFLQSLLKLTGGIEVKGLTIDGDNAAKVLLNEAYNVMPIDETDAFFSDVASAAFDKVTGSLKDVNLTDLITTAENGIKDQHFMVWMANEEEQQAAEEVGAAGELKYDSSNPVLGVFAADDTYSKKSWYFSGNTDVSEGTENSDGTVTYHVTSTFTNHFTSDLVASSSTYITGVNTWRRDDTDMVMWVYLFAPAGGSISNLSASGADMSLMDFREMSYNGLQVMEAEPRIDGGETLTVTYDVTCAAGAAPLTLRQQPTAQKVAGWE